jgi:hypothetical protein
MSDLNDILVQKEMPDGSKFVICSNGDIWKTCGLDSEKIREYPKESGDLKTVLSTFYKLCYETIRRCDKCYAPECP